MSQYETRPQRDVSPNTHLLIKLYIFIMLFLACDIKTFDCFGLTKIF